MGAQVRAQRAGEDARAALLVFGSARFSGGAHRSHRRPASAAPHLFVFIAPERYSSPPCGCGCPPCCCSVHRCPESHPMVHLHARRAAGAVDSDAGGAVREGEERHDSQTGAAFLRWYASRLRTHGEQVLQHAREVFGSDMRLAAKVSGIHWLRGHPSKAAEATAGYVGPYTDDICTMLSKTGTVLDFTCFEMRDATQSWFALYAATRALRRPRPYICETLGDSPLAFSTHRVSPDTFLAGPSEVLLRTQFSARGPGRGGWSVCARRRSAFRGRERAVLLE